MWRRHALLLSALLGSACNLEGTVSGLAEELLDPERSSVDAPGRQVAKGSYSDLELDASLAVGARLLALRHDQDEQELAIIPFEGGAACHVGPATRFMRLASQVDVDLPPIVGYLGDLQDGRGTLRFVDFSCGEVMPELENVSLPQVLYPRGEPTGFLTLSGAGHVYFVDVTRAEVSTVAESVRAGRVGNDHLWLIESGELIARDANFEAAARYGSNVQEFALFSGLQRQGITDAAYIDAGNLYLVTGIDGEPIQLAQDACGITDIRHSGAFAFYSPCDSRRLTIAYKKGLVDTEDDEISLVHLSPPHIDPDQLDLVWGDGYGAAVFVTIPESGAKGGELLMQVFEAGLSDPEPAVQLHETAHIGAGKILLVDYADDVGTLANLDFDTDEDGRPELVSLDLVAEGVAQLPGVTASSSLGVLGDYDADKNTGNLLLFSNDLQQEPQTLVHDVPIQRHARDNMAQRSAFVGDYDGTTGTAYLLQQGAITSLGEGVLPGTLRFVQTPEAVAYLSSSSDSRVRALTLYLLQAQAQVVLKDRVNEFHSLPWPSPGMLYSVSDGADQGIWFARSK